MPTFNTLTAAYLLDLQSRNASRATLATYEQSFITVRHFVTESGRSSDLAQLTSVVVRAYIV